MLYMAVQVLLTVTTADPFTVPTPQELLTRPMVYVVVLVGVTVTVKGDVLIPEYDCPLLRVKLQGLLPVKIEVRVVVWPVVIV